jgi:hypothetical protein
MSGDTSRLVIGNWGTAARAALLLGLLATGCGEGFAQAAFASDFDCPNAVAQGTAADDRYRVTGCGRTATYQCVGSTCAIQTVSDEESSPRARRRRLRNGDAEDLAPTSQPRAQAVASDVSVKSGEKGAFMVLELALEGKALLRLTATPDTRSDLMQLKVVRPTRDESEDKCSLDFMLNGQVLAMPKATPSRTGVMLSHRVQIGRELIQDFGTAEKISIRSCDSRWALDREQVDKVRAFVDRFQEELAWKAPARAGSSGGMLAPSGGWPGWSGGSQTPQAVTGPALDGPALFKKLSPSIFQLEASRGEGKSQGSAVAITPTELLTNCHVLQGALKLSLKQGKQQWSASIVRADPASDRCVVTAAGLKAQPIAGVRSHESLEVGEPAYTLGSPVGLELTLSSGIVSGRREEEKRRYVQTTAPISPGSSGGGLFDARGNLIGITTLVLVGREHLNQSLNFAIPAEGFWQP